MSSTIMFIARPGGLEEHAIFRNAWGSAMYIWSALCKKYLGIDSPLAFMVDESKQKKLWGLASDPRLTQTERIVHATTFDRAMVKRENCADLANRFEKFVKINPLQQVCTLKEQAEALRRVPVDAIAVCWVQTSVVDGIWDVLDPVSEESRSYDISRDTGHFFIYDDKAIMEASNT